MSGIGSSRIGTITGSTPLRPQGAVIHSVSPEREYRVAYGVQSASFVRTVFPGAMSGTYTRKTAITNDSVPKMSAAAAAAYRRISSPPVPYPPGNASAYYSNPQHRIVGNTYYCPTCR